MSSDLKSKSEEIEELLDMIIKRMEKQNKSIIENNNHIISILKSLTCLIDSMNSLNNRLVNLENDRVKANTTIVGEC